MPIVTEDKGSQAVKDGWQIYAINIGCEVGIEAADQTIQFHFKPVKIVGETVLPDSTRRKASSQMLRFGDIATWQGTLADGSVITGAKVAEALSLFGYSEVLSATLAAESAAYPAAE